MLLSFCALLLFAVLHYSNLKGLAKAFAIALGGVSLSAGLLYSISRLVISRYCSSHACRRESLATTSQSVSNHASIRQCVVSSLLLVHGSGSTATVRDKILLLGKQNSIAEYVLPVMHLSKFDMTLSDSTHSRQGLSAVKYGFPISIPDPSTRLLLFKLGFADAIVLAPETVSSPVKLSTVKYRFRLQPYEIRRTLPTLPTHVGISEDSEIVEQHLLKHPTLFDQPSYKCL